MTHRPDSTNLITSKNTEPEIEIADHLADNERPLRTVIMLHAEPVWVAVILVTIVAEFQIILYCVTFRGFLLDITKEPRSTPLQPYVMMMEALYCADFLLALSYRTWTSISVVSGIQPRKRLGLLLDVVSLIPVDAFLWYGSDLALTNPGVFHLWSLNHLIRIYRLYLFFGKSTNGITWVSIQIHLVQVLTILLVISMLAVVIMFKWRIDIEKEEYGWLQNVVDRLEPNNYRSNDWFWISFYVIIGHVSSHGTIELPVSTDHVLFAVFAMIGALGIRSLLLAYMVDIIQRRDYAKSIFTLKRSILDELMTSAVTIQTRHQIHKYYDSFWETEGGQKFRISDFIMYPLIFKAECSLELSWATFKHSKLFRHMPVPFLRNVSLLCERKFVSPGDYIFRKFDIKDRLIYIVSGSVHVLSEEDNETPILSFSGGTIFGEIALLASYRSGVSVLACTPCELNVLERNKFARIIIPSYPEIWSEITSVIDTRLKGAKFMTELGVYLQKNQNVIQNNRNTDVAWLKTSLSALQGAQRVDGGIKEMKKRANLMEQVYASTDIRYTFMYLDTLVLSDNIALTSDAVFLQSSKCPWILKPGSPVLQLWDTIVLISTITLSYTLTVSIAFQEFETDVVHAWTIFIGLVLTADLWVVLCTAIQKNDRITIIKVSQILKIRLHDWTFWFDLVAAVPWTVLVSAMPVEYSFLGLLKLLRMLKLYKLEIMFTRIENSHKISLVVLRMVKYSLYVILISFFFTGMLLFSTCPARLGVDSCPPTSWISTALAGHEQLTHKVFSYSLLVVLQIVLGIGTPIARPGSSMECAFWVILIIFGALLYIFYMASLTSVRILGQVIYARHYHLSQAIHYHLNKTTVPEALKKRVDSYLETEMRYDRGYRVVTNEDVLSTLSPEMSANWKYERFNRLISNVPLFTEMDQGFIRDICSIASIAVLPPRELLSYGGRHCTEMYIIEKGYCEMIHMEPSIPHRKVGPGTSIYVLEMSLQLPVVHTVVTSTYVSFLTISRNDFLRVYSNFPEEKFEFDQLLAEFHRMEQVLELREQAKEQPEFVEVLHTVRPPIPSFTFFVYTINKEDPEYYVISEPFERLKNFKFLKWCLLRLTIRPDGRFLKYYEAQRCICAIMTTILYTMRIIVQASDSRTFITRVITFLNIAALLDIYVRMHVGYFNEKGLLVTHPLSTASQYMTTSMFVDLLGLLPFEQLILRKMISSKDLFFFYLTRVLQLHRVIGAVNYLQESDSWSKVIKYGKFLPILLLIAHIFACVVLYTSCIFDAKYEDTAEFKAGLRCPQWHSFIEASTKYKLTDWIVYRRSLYIAVSTLTRVGVEELQIKTPSMMNVFYIMSAVTFTVLLLLMGQVMADSAIRDVELTAYQDRMTTLVNFMNNKKIGPELHDEVISYFELAWRHKRGQSVDRLFGAFHPALREDVLCALYSECLSKCPGLADASETFYRYLLMHLRGVWFYPNGSVIVHYNDVVDLVCVIHTGSAEVVAPDGSYVTTLGPGSVYGNLIGSTTVRMPVSIVVTAHMEALIFDADEFYRALTIHRKAKHIFMNAMELNTDYISANFDDQVVVVTTGDSSTDEQFYKGTRLFGFLRFLSMRVVDPNWLPIVLWDRNVLFFSYYLSPCAIIYQIAYGEFNIYWISFQYFTDFLFLVTMYIKANSAFEDKSGNVVRDKRRIWMRFVKSPMGFYAHLASVVPIEVISFTFRDRTMQRLYATLRVNRILRLAAVVDFFNVQCQRLNINIFNMRLTYLIAILLFTVHLASCILAFMTIKEDIYDLDDSTRRTVYFSNVFHVSALYGGSTTRRLPIASSWYYTCYILMLEIIMFVMFALIVGDMCAMINVSHYVMITYERIIKRFKIYMETCDLTYVLRQNMWTYGCNLWDFNRGRQVPHLVLEAPRYLRREIKNALFIHHLENHQIFSGCHEDFLRQVADHFILLNFFADDLIVNAGDVNGTMYFIDSGKVLTIHHDSNKNAKEDRTEIFEEGDSFGVLSGLFPRYPHRMTHRAFGTCKILKLNGKKWFYLLQHFPASRDHLYEIASELKAQAGPIRS
ncbi:uncharacterized protein LOC124182029 [Neodiprion fabricii]|uniref:uncharacterized protein LOC124182029 n=1 Tax=Neodiprion fabricii TaxID=2872261 RepID=UPI001ED8F619|nr:uncharacterized protein LOC124182029 [Neodiprion fabricii]